MRTLLTNEEPPTSFIRIDRSHFVKSLFRSKQLQRIDKKKAYLFRRIIGYIMQSSSLEEIEIIVKDLFIIISFEFIDKSVSAAKERLMKLVQLHIVEKINSNGNNENKCEELSTSGDSYKETENYTWIKSIYNGVKSNIKQKKVKKGAVDNFYYSPDITEYFIRLFVRLPLWSNVMCTKFKSTNVAPSSSGSESNFKNIKHLLKRPYRVDKFLKFHLNHLSGYLKLSLAEHNSKIRQIHSLRPTVSSVKVTKRRHLNDSTDDSIITNKGNNFETDESAVNESSTFDESLERQTKQNLTLNSGGSANGTSTEELTADKSSTFDESMIRNLKRNSKLKSAGKSTEETENNESSSFDESLQKDFEENWKNKNSTKNVKTNRRSKSSILNPKISSENGNIPILKNGHTSSNKKIVTIHTCAFDSIYSIYAVACADYKLHNEDGTMLFEFIKRTLDKNTRTVFTQQYDERNNILEKLYTNAFDKECVTRLPKSVHIDCEIGIGDMFAALVKNDSKSLASLIITRKCKCLEDQEIIKPLISTNPRNLKLNALKKNINLACSSEYTIYCKVCSDMKFATCVYSNIVAIEVEPICRNKKIEIPIAEITQSIQIEKESYELFGIIEYIAVRHHFIAYVKRSTEQWQIFDDLNYDKQNNSCTLSGEALKIKQIQPFLLFYLSNK